MEPIAYEDKDVQAGYRSGDIAYWIPGEDFAIFTENKKEAPGTPDLAVLGKVVSDMKEDPGSGPYHKGYDFSGSIGSGRTACRDTKKNTGSGISPEPVTGF